MEEKEMEENIPNAEPDMYLEPPLKKARYHWQVKGQKRNRNNEASLKQCSDITKGNSLRHVQAENVAATLLESSGKMKENERQCMKQSVSDTKYYSRNHIIAIDDRLSDSEGDASIIKSHQLSQEMVQGYSKMGTICSEFIKIPPYETTHNSILPGIAGCSFQSHVNSSDVSTKQTVSDNSVLKGTDNSKLSEAGCSTVIVDDNAGTHCDQTENIMAIESSNSNFMDLIQTKVDIQAKKLNLMNMVHSNRQGETLSYRIQKPGNSFHSFLAKDDLTACSFDMPSHEHVSIRLDSNVPTVDVSSPHSPSEEDTFLCHWQSQHTAKAIVDNAINKTLEEMGLTPEVSTSDWNRLFLEDEGVNEAIRFRGLWLRDNNDHNDRIHPLISQITGASEQVFELSLESATRIYRPTTECEVRVNNLPTNEKSFSQQLKPIVNEEKITVECLTENDDNGEEHVLSDASEHASDDVLQFAVSAAITSRGLSIRNDLSL